jgi:D-alanine-D-alanine ligase
VKSLLLLCGGVSGEHEVSLVSAKHFVTAVDEDKFKLHLVGIDRSGGMRKIDRNDLMALSDRPDSIQLPAGKPVSFEKKAYVCEGKAFPIDLAFPLLHGEGGEDGKIQGWLETLGIPYVGSGVKASALGMDKALTKILASQAGVPIVPFKKFSVGQTLPADDSLFPLFVKPSTSGSSLGVTKVRHVEDLLPAAEEAWKHSLEAMIEPAVVGREIEIALLDDGHQRLASVPGEIRIRKEGDFYSYEAKYLQPDAAELIAPASLTEEQTKELTRLAWKTFDALGCKGIARVDFFLTEQQGFLLNEINTMPGFTPISMYPRLLQLAGLSYPDLVARLMSSAQSGPRP